MGETGGDRDMTPKGVDGRRPASGGATYGSVEKKRMVGVAFSPHVGA
jgi:hypothetical protein